MSAVIVFGGDETPAFMGLALDVSLTGLALGIERVELKLEIVVGRFAGIDRAAAS